MQGKKIFEVSFNDVGKKLGPGGGMCCAFWSAVMFVLIILFFPATVIQLGQKQIGLAKNKVTGTVDLDSTFYPGRYWLGFWREFIIFPSTLNTIEFSDETPEEGVQNLRVLETRDSEGKRVFLDLSVQYQLIPSRVGQLYREMTTLYEDVYISALRDELAKVCNTIVIAQAWENYAALRSAMKAACERTLELRHAVCWDLQVWRVRLLAEYEGALIRTQVRKQAQRTEEARLVQSTVRAQTQVILAEYRKNVTVITATGEAQKYQIERDATARAEQNLIKAQADVLEIVRDTVKLDTANGDSKDLTMNEAQLLTYQKNVMLHGQKDAHMVFSNSGSDLITDIRSMQSGMQMTGGRLLTDDPDEGEDDSAVSATPGTITHAASPNGARRLQTRMPQRIDGSHQEI